MRTIYEFKKGDEITRIEPAKPYSPVRISLFGQEEDGVRDRSYMGEKLIFVGIANGQVYFRRTDELSLRLFGDKLKGVSLDLWSEGWDYYFDPLKLEHGEVDILDKAQIETQINKAIKEENYELAARLKKSIEDDKN